MSEGKYTSLEEAKDKASLNRFIKQHPSKGDKKQFDNLLDRMVNNKFDNRKKKS